MASHSKWCMPAEETRKEMLSLLEKARSAPRKSFGNQHTTNPDFKTSEETRRKISLALVGKTKTLEQKQRASEAAIKRCESHPHTQFFGRPERYRSEPCERLKSIFREEGLTFAEEFRPLTKRFFRLDIAFTDVKLAIEVNGNQHYAEKMLLKPYYQSRHDLIEESGWEIIEVHFKSVYNSEFVNALIGRVKRKLSEK
jgi:very-short-patch-repair endonuclease